MDKNGVVSVSQLLQPPPPQQQQSSLMKSLLSITPLASALMQPPPVSVNQIQTTVKPPPPPSLSPSLSSTSLSSTAMSLYFAQLYAGAFSSFIATVLLHPFDVVRLTQMANETSLKFTLKEIYRCYGKTTVIGRLSNFYRALPISLLAYVSTYALYFPLNSYIKRENPLNLNNRYMIYMFANIPPSMLTLTLFNPLWTIKAHQISNNFELRSVRNTISDIYRRYGCRGFTKGLLFGYLNSINGILTFTFYDIMKDLITEPHTALDYTVCSLTSKTLATIIAYPLIVLRIRHQVTQKSFCATFLTIFTKNPITLYYGITPTLLQQLPKTIIMMVIYELLLK